MTMGPKTERASVIKPPLGTLDHGAVIYGHGGFGAEPEQDSGQAWMVTFTDLVALMLTFFVLLFSMSRIDEVQWQNLKDSISLGLDRVSEFKVPFPEEELDIKRVTALPGDDLGYLASVLDQHMEEISSLSDVLIENRGDQLRLVLQTNRHFEPAGGNLTVAGEDALFAIGGIVASLSNRIEVAGHALPLETASRERIRTWEAALVRAQAVAGRLISAGYRGGIPVRALGARSGTGAAQDTSAQNYASPAGRVDIIIRAHSVESF